MTLTRYQRGDPMEGWNDCPPLMLAKGSSGPSGRRNRKKRVASDVYSNTSLSDSWVMVSDTDVSHQEDVDLTSLFAYPSSITENEFQHYAKKLETIVPGLKGSDKLFINSIIQQTNTAVTEKNKSLVNDIKTAILNYMMLHSNVTSWCTPLKKLVEGIEIA